MAKILYVGPDSGTSRHRFHALGRLGHDVRLVDPFTALAGTRSLTSWGFKTGYLGLETRIERSVLGMVGDEQFDVVWVDNGETVGRNLATALKKRARFIVNHNLDNPFTGRDGLRWRLFRQALPVYDLFVTPRVSTKAAAIANGAARSVVVMFSADEQVHRPIVLNEEQRAEYGSDVAFVGTWMPERGPFMTRLMERGVPLRIFGPRWTKAPEYPKLASIVRSSSLNDEQYVRAIAGTKIAVGLLSVGNHDLHTTRSLEIPAIGTLFCAPRTSDHEALYENGKEAVFFGSADECADACFALLADEPRRIAISKAGHGRAIRNNWFNERLCADILAALPSG